MRSDLSSRRIGRPLGPASWRLALALAAALSAALSASLVPVPLDAQAPAAAPKDAPQALLDQLSPEGGVMVIPMGRTADSQHLWRLTRTGEEIAREKLMAVRFVPLLPGVADDTKP